MIFVLFEIADIKYNGLDKYFGDVFKVFDASLPFIFITHIFIRVYFEKIDKFGLLKLTDKVVQILIVLGSNAKIL